MQENNNLHQVEKKEVSTEQIELMRKAAISCDKAARSIEEMTHEFSNFYNGTISGAILPDDIAELKSQLNPIVERYKEAVSKSMECFFLIGNHDSYENVVPKSREWFAVSEPESLTKEQIDPFIEAWNKYDIAEEQYDGKVK